MALTDMLRRNGGGSGLREILGDLQQERWQNELLQEDLRRLELAMEEEGWRRLSTRLDREFTRSGLDDLMKLSRAMYLSHPLIQRAVNVRTYYTWGQGVEFTAAEQRIQDEVILPLIEDDGNRCELYGHQGRVLTDVDQMVDGNTFHALFTGPNGEISVRSIPAEEIRDIHTSPDDRRQVWFYRRSWTQQSFSLRTGDTKQETIDALYPDWRYQPTSKPQKIGSYEVMWDSPVIHLRTGGLKQMRFGVPETYAALDWARAYRRFLEDWHTIVASLARFAWSMTTKGRKVAAAKEKLGSTIPTSGYEENRPPAAGSVFIAPEGDQLTPIPKTGASTSADDARPSRLMVAAAMDLPDTILSGDPDMGNLATAKTLDRPTELAMRHRQTLWADFHQDLFRYAIQAKIRRGGLPANLDESVDVSFPPILEHDTQALVTAIVTAATLDGKAEAGTIPREKLSEMLLTALGEQDVQATLEQLGKEQQASLAQAVEALAEAVRR